jgi:DNA-binding response OmpR family regulator
VIFVIEQDAPLYRLMVWGLREKQFEAMSVPMPSEAPSFGDRVPTHVIINCELPIEECLQLVKTIRAAVPGVPILDLGQHGAACGADQHLREPYNVGDVIQWLDQSAEPVAR